MLTSDGALVPEPAGADATQAASTASSAAVHFIAQISSAGHFAVGAVGAFSV